MSSHLFILGRTPDMALMELKTFFPDVTLVSTGVAMSHEILPISVQEVIAKLGGTVKVALHLGEAAAITPETIASHVDMGDGRTNFGVSVFGEARTVQRKILDEAKSILEGHGSSVRFVEAKGAELTSVAVEKHNVQEIVFVRHGDHYVVGRTLAVQPFEAWNLRDFGRPQADTKAGMLPPKVSRMVVNIADGSRMLKETLSRKTLLDPFCGMGTILAEGLVMGWNVVGSDVSLEVTTKCRANLRWLTEKHLSAEGVTYRLETADAVHISDHIDAQSIDAIVTEPFMGRTIDPQRREVTPDVVKDTLKGLEKLYIGCLKDWRGILKTGGRVMMALPMYHLNGRTYFVKKVIDMCENLGYTIQAGPIEYGRPQATVSRVFYLFQKV